MTLLYSSSMNIIIVNHKNAEIVLIHSNTVYVSKCYHQFVDFTIHMWLHGIVKVPTINTVWILLVSNSFSGSHLKSDGSISTKFCVGQLHSGVC